MDVEPRSQLWHHCAGLRQAQITALGAPVRALTQPPGQPGARQLTRRCSLPEPVNCLVAKLAKPDLHGGQ